LFVLGSTLGEAAPTARAKGLFVTDVMGETDVMGVTDLMGETGVMCITDDELTALALAADPDAPLGEDAVALPLYPDEPFGALPAWYMPPAMARVAGGWRRVAIFAIIAGFLVIDAFGLCITYGQLVAA
jgi:hypothetical protein